MVQRYVLNIQILNVKHEVAIVCSLISISKVWHIFFQLTSHLTKPHNISCLKQTFSL